MIRKRKTRGLGGHKRLNQPPFGYFGSKNRLALELCRNLPPHNAWVEAFCGSAAVTLAKSPAPIEVINDIDDQIVNLFQQLRTRPRELCRMVALTPYAREELSLARKSKPSNDSLEMARRFLVESMMAVNGVFGKECGGFSYSLSYSRQNREARVNRWYNLPERLSKVVERLRTVRVEKRNAIALLKDYLDKPATLVYLDPPYFTKRTNGYNRDANDVNFHKELLALANKARCMIMLSGYDNTLYKKTLSRDLGWTSRRIKTTTKDSLGRTHARTEVVWMNRQYTEALKNKRIGLRLSHSERKSSKVNPSR